MDSGALKKAKRQVRGRVREARDALSAAERAVSSTEIARRFMDLPEVAGARAVMLFSSFGSEADTAQIIEGLAVQGVTTALPRIVEGELQVRSYAPGDETIQTSFGAREPAEGAILDPTSLDVVLTPGVAFDRSGRRIGYGGGFYDRFLLHTRPGATRIGICFGVQLLDEELPAASFDLPVEIVVTESETLRCPRR